MLNRGNPEHGGRIVPGHRPSAAGLRRVAWVRVTILPGGPRCHAVGTGHRNPVVRRIPLSTATELIAGGVPSLVVRRHNAPIVGDRAPARAGARQ